MYNNLIQFLKTFGLTEKEVKTYLACLELGKSSVIKIAKRANLKRTTVYNVVESLLDRSFLSKYEDEKGQKFVAETPEKLVDILDERKKELLQWMPNLLAMTNTGGSFKPEVRFYQGLEGIKTVCEDSLSSCEKGDEILAIASGDDVTSFLPDYISNYMNRRAEKGITMRAIAPDTEISRAVQKKDKKHKRYLKLVPEKDLLISIEKNIYKDKVVLMNYRGFPFATIIKSAPLAKSEKAIFELLWKKLP